MDRDVEPAYRNATVIGDEDDLIGTPVDAREASDDVARRRGIAELHGKGGDRIRVVGRHGADCHGTVAATDVRTVAAHNSTITGTGTVSQLSRWRRVLCRS